MFRNSVLILLVVFSLFHLASQSALGSKYSHKPYSYGYDIKDNYGNRQWRQEKSTSDLGVHGSYGFSDSDGIYREVHYVADKFGFRASIKTNEPTILGRDNPASVQLEPAQPSSHNHLYAHKKLSFPKFQMDSSRSR